MQHTNAISFRVNGRRALFSDPITRTGGEKCTYPVPTYQALKGIMESVYWKPTLIWRISKVRVMNPIRTEAVSVRPIEYGGGNTLSIYHYLRDVDYQVEAYFVWNEERPDLRQDWNENKHFFMAKRMLERGGRRDIFLGTRECQGYAEPCVFGEGASAYQNSGELPFGCMFHGFNYPGETGKEELEARFWNPVMRDGIIEFPQPENCSLVRSLGPQPVTSFIPGRNFTFCDELFREEGGKL